MSHWPRAVTPGRRGTLAALTRGCCRASPRSGLRPRTSWSSGTRGTSGPSLRGCSPGSSPPWYTCQPCTTGRRRGGDVWVGKVAIADWAQNPGSLTPILRAGFLRSYITRRTQTSSQKNFLQEESENFRNWGNLMVPSCSQRGSVAQSVVGRLGARV